MIFEISHHLITWLLTSHKRHVKSLCLWNKTLYQQKLYFKWILFAIFSNFHSIIDKWHRRTSFISIKICCEIIVAPWINYYRMILLLLLLCSIDFIFVMKLKDIHGKMLFVRCISYTAFQTTWYLQLKFNLCCDIILGNFHFIPKLTHVEY